MGIKWINQNPGAQRDEQGYWVSVEGRFQISPNYRHTVYPGDYTVVDYMARRDGAVFQSEKRTFDRVRDCKEWAQEKVVKLHEVRPTA